MTNRTREKLNEAVAMLCVSLDIPYNPYESKPATEDKRPYIIANALIWVAEDVEAQCKRGEWSA